MPRLVLDVRRVVHPPEESDGEERQEEEDNVDVNEVGCAEALAERRYPQRERKPPSLDG